MKSLQRKTNLSDSDLSSFANKMTMYLERDASYFQARGVSDADRNAYKTVAESFKSFPMDFDYLGMIKEAVDAKLEVRSNATKLVQKLSGYFEQAYGLDSVEYDRLEIKGFMNLNGKAFLFTGRNVATVASDHLSGLSAIGLTQAEIDLLSSEMDEFEAKVYAVAEMKNLRKEKRLERIVLGNELYDLVAKYCRIGKLIWEEVNSVKYENYLIYLGWSKKAKKLAEKD